MNAVLLTLFLSLGLVSFSLLLFAVAHKAKDFDHADRLSLLPLEEDTAAPSETPPLGTQE